jgi:histidinol-phosphate aminotransferase
MSIFKQHIDQMGAYKPPLDGRDPKKHTLLDFNERTIPIAPEVEDALVAYIRDGRMQMYPAYGDVVEQIADYCGVPAEQVMITNGSDQGIDLITRSACREGDEIIIPGPSFAMYTQCAKIENLEIIAPQYTREQGFPVQGVIDAVSDKTRLICIANPNNPSGTLIPREDIMAILEAAPKAAVLIDECYFEYAKASVCDLVLQYPNLLITRTFSKTWGMPSLRLGYVISAPDNILALLNVRGPYDINQLAIVAILAALKSPQNMERYVDEVMGQSKPLLEAYLQENNITFWPSGGNFIWMFPESPERINDALLAAGILVRPKQDQNGQVGLRITLGTLEQTTRLIEVLKTQ